MLRRLAAIIVLTAAPAIVAPAAALASGKSAQVSESDAYVDLAAVGLPIVVEGQVRNYVFVQVRLLVSPGQDATTLKAAEPQYRDALVRAGHRAPFVDPKDWTVVDEARLKSVLLAEARRISGPKAFKGVEIKSQTPRRRVGMLRPGVKPRS